MDLLEVMTFDECLHALAAKRVGRIALTHRALPVVFPVNYVLDGHSILLRTAPGTALAAARDEVVVAFEIDDVDDESRSGWSVLVTGFMRELTEPEDVVRADELGLVTWTGGSREHYVRITPARVTGRRIVPRPAAGHAGAVGAASGFGAPPTNHVA
jgi:uncharacterized protein